MPISFLGLGSNKGERLLYIEKALSEISKLKDTRVLNVSSIYETEPWGISQQENYLNCAVEIDTYLNADDLLKELKKMEKILGRVENKKWFEREIDIDILFYDNVIIESDIMKIPHPQIENRKFVLIPMKEIAPEHIHPVLEKSISQLLNETDDKLRVTKYTSKKIDTL